MCVCKSPISFYVYQILNFTFLTKKGTLERTASPHATMAFLALSEYHSRFQVFHAQAKPEISIKDYMIRINKYGNFSNSVSVAAMIYIDRIIENHPEIVLTSRTVHRLLIAAMLLAAKFNDDVHLGNSAFAQIGGIRTAELNRLEVSFLKLCEFSLVVSSELYSATVSAFETQMSGMKPVEVAALAENPFICGLGSPIGYKGKCGEGSTLETMYGHPLNHFSSACSLVSAS